ncbi:hypothetical protein WJX74_000006 [Apatococcus lobatus]|uniref:Uncharacterized protein n=1 Tax=Apatococcus lobatus TaxID=904363 RepID=A0AAW1RP74_9CHLO
MEDSVEASNGPAQADRVAINFRDTRSFSIAFGDLDTRSIDAVGHSGRPGAALVALCQQTHNGLDTTLFSTPVFSWMQTSQAFTTNLSLLTWMASVWMCFLSAGLSRAGLATSSGEGPQLLDYASCSLIACLD